MGYLIDFQKWKCHPYRNWNLVLIRMNDITLGQYAPGDSLVHRLDPRTKLISCMLLMLAFLLINRYEILLASILFISVVFRISGLSAGLAFRNLRPFWLLFLFTFILHLFFTDGRILFRLPWVHWMVTLDGIQKGLFYTCRIVLFVILSSLLTLTTSPMSLTDAIGRILSPLKRFGVPAHAISMMMGISLRMIPILVGEADRIRSAQISRGAGFEGNLFKRLKNLIPLIIPLFMSSFRKANHLAMAMESRCYKGDEGRTSYTILKFRRSDFIVMFTVTGLCLLIWIIR